MDHDPTQSPPPERRSERRAGPWAWWEAHGRRALFMLTLVAMAAPTAVWLQGRHEQRMLTQAYRQQAKLIRFEARLDQRHNREMRFLDTALDPRANRVEREAALRYLSTKLSERNTTRLWAIDELERMRRSCGQ